MTDFPEELKKRYTYESTIGSGAMGVVFLAHDQVLDKNVAIKMLGLSSQSKTRLIRFQKEAKASAKLNHDNIVKILDFGIISDGGPYMVMDYVGTYNLTQFMNETDYSLRDVLNIVGQVAIGMAHAHSNGVIHRDLKSSNIMVEKDESGEVLSAKVIDFGIAHLGSVDAPEGVDTTGNAILGTPGYISPEAIYAERVDARTDIYSLGCVFYELITGELPFQTDDPMKMMEMHAKQEPPSIVSKARVPIEDEFMAELDKIVTKCMAKNPDKRFPSMGVLDEQLEDFAERYESVLRDKQFPGEERNSHGFFGLNLPWQSVARRGSFLPAVFIVSLSVLTLLMLFFVWKAQQTVSIQNRTQKVGGIVVKRDFSSLLPDVLDMTAEKYYAKQSRNDGVTDSDLLDGKFKPDDPQHINLVNSKISDRGLVALNLEFASKIELDSTMVSDLGMEHIAGYPDIDEVSLNMTQVGDVGLKYLSKLPKIHRLEICRTKVTDEGMKEIGKMSTLSRLDISDCELITGKGAAYLKNIPSLSRLRISGTQIRPKDVIGTSVDVLSFEFSNLTMDDIEALKKLKLRRLTLTGCVFPEGGLFEMAKIPGLAMLNIASCDDVDEKKLVKLSELMPGCFIQTVLPYDKNPPKGFAKLRK